jgi:signal transduction histidine kinase
MNIESDDKQVELLTPEILVPRVGDVLVEKGYLSPKNLERALIYQRSLREQGKPTPLLGQILIEMKLVERQIMDQVITEQILKLKTALQDANLQLEQRVLERTAELEEALRQLSELNKMKSNFVANISHELRTPLTHLRGYLDLLVAGDLGKIQPEQVHVLGVMQRAADRLQQLIEDLIMFSISEHGQITLRPQPFKLNLLFSAAYKSFEERATAQNIHLEYECMPDSLQVDGDKEKIVWVLNQLLDNAIKFTAAGGFVWLRAETDSKLVRISVTDTGIGIPKDKIQQIFEPFHQLDSSSTRKYGGVGLGLALVSKIIKAHGSVIRVSSEIGKGSQFIFLLPLAKDTSNNLSRHP